MEFLRFSLKSWAKILVILSIVSVFVVWLVSDNSVLVKLTEYHQLKRDDDSRKHIPQNIFQESPQNIQKGSSSFPKPTRIIPTTENAASENKQAEADNPKEINAARVQTMMKYCKTLKEKVFFYKKNHPKRITPRHFSHLYVNDKYKLIHCNVPKVACTNWKRLSLALSGVPDASFIPGHSIHDQTGEYFDQVEEMKLSHFSPSEISRRLQQYTKVIIVRDPLERILSAFRNKLKVSGVNGYFLHKYGSLILKRYHPTLSQEKIKNGELPLFEDFVRFLVHPMDFPELQPWVHMNEHWERYFALCHPCFVKYNIIVKFETLEKDVKFVLDRINASSVFHWPKRKVHYLHTPTSSLISNSVRNISDADLHALWNLYYDDYKMFGYAFNIPGKENVSLQSQTSTSH